MSIEFTRDGTTIISEVKPEHQVRLLQLIGQSLRKKKEIQYDFTEALEAFTVLSPQDKRKEIHAWMTVMENILNGNTNEKNQKNKEPQVRDSCGL